MELVKRLANLATSLDDAKLAYMADDIDVITKNIVKVSQYLGVQGYWIRNERCWSNCYRKKRQDNSKMPAQKVWEECQKEYEASINVADSSWDKYAENDGFVKTARTTVLDKAFIKVVTQRVASGEETGEAIYGVLGTELNVPAEIVMSSADQLFQISDRLELINPSLSKEAGELGVALVKLGQFRRSPAGWLSDVWNRLRPKNWNQSGQDAITLKQLTDRMQRALWAAQKARAQFPQGNTPVQPAEQARLTQDYNNFVQRVGGDIAYLRNLGQKSQRPEAMQLLQGVEQAYQQLSSQTAAGPGPRRANLDKFISALQQGNQQISQIQQQPQQPAQQNNSTAPVAQPAPATSPSQQAPMGQAPMGQAPMGQAPMGQAPMGQAPAPKKAPIAPTAPTKPATPPPAGATQKPLLREPAKTVPQSTANPLPVAPGVPQPATSAELAPATTQKLYDLKGEPEVPPTAATPPATAPAGAPEPEWMEKQRLQTGTPEPAWMAQEREQAGTEEPLVSQNPELNQRTPEYSGNPKLDIAPPEAETSLAPEPYAPTPPEVSLPQVGGEVGNVETPYASVAPTEVAQGDALTPAPPELEQHLTPEQLAEIKRQRELATVASSSIEGVKPLSIEKKASGKVTSLFNLSTKEVIFRI